MQGKENAILCSLSLQCKMYLTWRKMATHTNQYIMRSIPTVTTAQDVQVSNVTLKIPE